LEPPVHSNIRIVGGGLIEIENWPLVCRKSSVSRKAVVRKFGVGTGVSKIASCKVFARFIEVPDFAVENHLWILFTEK